MTNPTASERFLWAFATTCALLLSIPAVAADNASTATVNHAYPDRADTLLLFRQQGTLVTVNSDNDADLDAPAATVTSNQTEKHWTFDINHVSGLSGAGVFDFTASIQGTHLSVPHPVLPENQDDPLPLVQGSCAPGSTECVNANYSVPDPITYTVSASGNGDLHDDTTGVHGHSYSVKLTGSTPTQQAGAQFNSTFLVTAKHPQDPEPKASGRTGKGFGSSPANCSVDYDAGSSTLSFNIGSIDIVDSEGGQSAGVEAGYASDALLGADWSVSDLTYQGQLGDGRHEFGPGTVSVVDPSGNFGLEGGFDQYLIDDTSDDPLLTSFALLDELVIGTLQAAIDGGSIFLQDFIDANLHGDGMLDAEFRLLAGIDFAFVTATDLAATTNGFTQSTGASVPATCIVAANGRIGHVPLLPGWAFAAGAALLLLAGWLWLRARRSPTRSG